MPGDAPMSPARAAIARSQKLTELPGDDFMAVIDIGGCEAPMMVEYGAPRLVHRPKGGIGMSRSNASFRDCRYAIFFATFLYLIVFVGNFRSPQTVDVGPDAPVAVAVIIDVALIALFGAPAQRHGAAGLQAGWTRIVPKPAERSVYVLMASSALILFMCWRPIDAIVWNVHRAAARRTCCGLFGLGWATVLLSTFLINHFELFGLQQALFNMLGRAAEPPSFASRCCTNGSATRSISASSSPSGQRRG